MFMADHDYPRISIANVKLDIFIAQALLKHEHNLIYCIITVVANYNFYIYAKPIATEDSNPKGMVLRNDKFHGTLFYQSNLKKVG